MSATAFDIGDALISSTTMQKVKYASPMKSPRRTWDSAPVPSHSRPSEELRFLGEAVFVFHTTPNSPTTEIRTSPSQRSNCTLFLFHIGIFSCLKNQYLRYTYVMNPRSSNIFKGTAWYYARYRRQYPTQVFKDIIDYYKLNGKGCLLDLGCGTGEIAIPLAPYFEDVVGLDPSSDMLVGAKAKAKIKKVFNIKWVKGKAEDIELSFAPIRLTTAGVSFHWMNQPVVLEKVYRMTENNGGMVVIGDTSPVRGKEKTEDWKMKRKELIIKYLGEERRAGDHLHKDFIPEKRPFEELIEGSPFRTFEFKEYPYTTERNIDEIVGFLYSTSYANKRLFGDKADDFEQELRKELLELVPSGRFVESGKADVFLLQKS